jgi:hypothetical protein
MPLKKNPLPLLSGIHKKKKNPLKCFFFKFRKEIKSLGAKSGL